MGKIKGSASHAFIDDFKIFLSYPISFPCQDDIDDGLGRSKKLFEDTEP